MITLLSLETDKDTDVSTPEYFISVSVRIEIVHITVWPLGGRVSCSNKSQIRLSVTVTLCHENIERYKMKIS